MKQKNEWQSDFDESWVRHHDAIATIAFGRLCFWMLTGADEDSWLTNGVTDVEWAMYELLVYEAQAGHIYG